MWNNHFTFTILFNPHIYPVKKGTMGNPKFTDKTEDQGQSHHTSYTVRRSQDSDPDYELKACTHSHYTP